MYVVKALMTWWFPAYHDVPCLYNCCFQFLNGLWLFFINKQDTHLRPAHMVRCLRTIICEIPTIALRARIQLPPSLPFVRRPRRLTIIINDFCCSRCLPVLKNRTRLSSLSIDCGFDISKGFFFVLCSTVVDMV